MNLRTYELRITNYELLQYNMKHNFTFLFSLLAAAVFAQAPQWSNQGAVVSVKSGAFVSVRGDLVNDRAGTMDNNETIYVTGDWTNNVATPFTSTAQQVGTVKLIGDEQTIDGSAMTNFFDLHLEQTGVKHARQDVGIFGQLYLNDREFEADVFTIFVENPALNAVLTGLGGVWGFVSNRDNGGLQRQTNQSGQDYFFPVGSALAPARFRPMRINPIDNAATAYKVRFANTDATTESYDRSLREWTICDINAQYYHRISQPTTANIPAALTFLYDAAADGSFAGLAKWSAASLWSEVGELTANGVDATYNLDILQSAAAVADFAPNPFAFAQLAPPIDLAVAPNAICANSQILLTASGNYTTFDFYIDSTLVQSSPDTTYSQNGINQGTRLIWAAGTDGTCGRNSDTFSLNVLPPFLGQAADDTIIVTGTDATIYATNADFFDWQPATLVDCNTCQSTLSRPTETTTYTVRLENIDGCIIIDTMQVVVREDVASILFIPNVLTPNGDGKNDTWFIRNIDFFPRNKVIILNRWGDNVFKSEYYNNDWDGTFGSGKLPAGTYYYILDLGDGWGIFKGDVTIIRE
jgi:gliding motility-associated-like protein